jgi:5-(carboxyamino)imidazole ribonucleotide mutase
MNPLVGIIMGSKSDLPYMEEAAQFLEQMQIPFEITVVSAHRTPHRMVNYAETAAERGIKVIIAGAGGAAHLPGMVASLTTLPVVGVPVKSSNSIDGWDSILSILQMPNGIPVATVALNASKNAAILAAKILAGSDSAIDGKMREFQKDLKNKVLDTTKDFENLGFKFQVNKFQG